MIIITERGVQDATSWEDMISILKDRIKASLFGDIDGMMNSPWAYDKEYILDDLEEEIGRSIDDEVDQAIVNGSRQDERAEKEKNEHI